MTEEWSKVKAIRRDRGIGGPGGPHPRTEKPKQIGKTLLRLFGALSDNRIPLMISLFLIIISALAAITGTWYLKPLINEVIGRADLGKLAHSLVIIGLMYGTGALATYISSRLMIRIAQQTTNRIRAALFNHLQELPLRYFDSHTHGELMSRFTNDVDNVNFALEQSLSQTVTSLISVVGTFIMMLVLSPLLTVFIVLMLLVMGLTIKTVGGKSSSYFRGQQKALGDLNGYIEEMMEGQKVVKVFNHEESACRDFRVKNEALRGASTKAQTFASMLMPIMGNLSYINYAVTAMVGAILSIQGRMDIGTIAAFLQYTRSFSQPITQVANQVNMLLAALAGAERIFDVMDQVPENDEGEVSLVLARRNSSGSLESLSVDSADFTLQTTDGQPESAVTAADNTAIASAFVLAWRVPQPDGPADLIELRGDVRFSNVTFSYVEGKVVLKNVSLFAKPGQKIAFVGSTGAGKTTITNLINRFYEIHEGTITYDGIDIRRIRKADLRRTLGMVLQDVHLFKGTIRDNIRYGKPDASEAEIIRAAKIANAHGFISRLPDGYNTMLTPDGANLSQGQRQLLSIARAAVANPPVLILDEATSSIDTRTERLIERGMDQLMHGRTTFVIAHRLSTVRNAEAIMVLEHGEIIERGDHHDLMALHGRYYQLCTGVAELA